MTAVSAPLQFGTANGNVVAEASCVSRCCKALPGRQASSLTVCLQPDKVSTDSVIALVKSKKHCKATMSKGSIPQADAGPCQNVSGRLCCLSPPCHHTQLPAPPPCSCHPVAIHHLKALSKLQSFNIQEIALLHCKLHECQAICPL